MQQFASGLLEDQDFNVEVIKKAQYFLGRENLLSASDLDRFTLLIQQTTPKREESTPMETLEEGGKDEVMQEVEDEGELEAKYVEAMKDLVFDSISMQNMETEKYDKYHYADSLDSSKSASKSKMERLLKEMNMLNDSLPGEFSFSSSF